MIFITGETTARKAIAMICAEGWGRMFVEKKPTPYDGEPWGFDNGAYGWWVRGERFNAELYKQRLDYAYNIGTPYMAVVPDIVGEGEKSLEYSLNWISKLPKEWPWYLAVQDGMTTKHVLPIVKEFKGIFLGGTNSYKATAYSWCVFAHENNLPFHYGRAGTERKIQDALFVGADSADSAFPLWTYQRMRETIKYVRGDELQQCLFKPQEIAMSYDKKEL